MSSFFAAVYARSNAGNYRITSYAEAKALCTSRYQKIATEKEIKKFFDDYGLEKCGFGGCGYVYQSSAHKSAGEFPVYDPGCGNGRTLRKCPSNPVDDDKKGYDVWCFGPSTIPDQADKVSAGKSLYYDENDEK